jgi:hypothetical protein
LLVPGLSKFTVPIPSSSTSIKGWCHVAMFNVFVLFWCLFMLCVLWESYQSAGREVQSRTEQSSREDGAHQQGQWPLYIYALVYVPPCLSAIIFGRTQKHCSSPVTHTAHKTPLCHTISKTQFLSTHNTPP